MKRAGGHGKDEMSRAHNYDNLSNRIKTLAVVNVLQPVTKRSLVEHLRKTIHPDSISSILTELLDAGLVAKEKAYYRVTRRGLCFSISRQSRILRDIDRMKYLLATSKQRGGDSLGR